MPSSYEERVGLLDRLIEGQGLERSLADKIGGIGKDLGTIGSALPGGWERLKVLIDWLGAANSLAPALSVRNPNLLSWSDDPKGWAERLSAVSSRLSGNLSELVAIVNLENPQFIGNQDTLLATVGETLDRTAGWKEFAERYNEWPPVRQGMAKLAEATEGPFHGDVYNGGVQASELVDRVRLAILEQIWNRMVSIQPDLATVDGRILDRKVSGFRVLDRQRIGEAAYQVARRHYDHKPTGAVGSMGIIRGEVNKSRRLLPVRKLIEQAGHAVQQLKPLFLMSPLSIAQYLPPGKLQFDLLLIDEASQVRPEDALGAIARAEQVVVVGDAKQLPPTNFFNRLVSDGDDEEESPAEAGPPAVASMESILNLCDATFSSRSMLEWHYRSQHPALIAVSNRRFYDNRLLLPPSVVKGRAAEGLGVAFHKTPEIGYDRGRSASNVVEAEIVADAVCRFAKQWPEKSLGVGTFSVAQRDAIRDQIDARRRIDPSLEPFFSTGRDHPFFVKNLESIQGDERDVIFISVGYGRGADGRLVQNFGPINNDGGERRLNVLISRARERCEVFSPITADDIDSASRKLGVVAFKEFLQYAEKGYFDIPTPTGNPFDSDFEESVAEFLRGRGFKVDPQVGMSGFYIDLGVIDSANESRYLLGIECDGATYHSSRSARDRDRIRQNILESRGWTIHRIWSTDWFHRPAAEETRLLDSISRVESQKGVSRPQPIQMPDPPQLPTPGPANDPPLPKIDSAPYLTADFRIASAQMPHEAPKSLVQDAVCRIVRIEGPIHEDEVSRRLATVWGMDRAGSRIQAAAREALIACARNGKLARDCGFWTAPGGPAFVVRSRADVDVPSLRSAKYLPPAEIALCAKDVVKENVRVSQSELVVEIARRFGFQRTGQDLQEAIQKVIGAQIEVDLMKHDDGSISLR